jgi:hypothetical protein
MDGWPFDQGPGVEAVTTQAVLDGAPILIVVHYSDDRSWAFLEPGSLDPDESRVVSMGAILRLHPSIAEIAGLPPGWMATRESVATPWVRATDPEI